MERNKFDLKSDGIADIYRAALYLARGLDKTGLDFFNKARSKLKEQLVCPPSYLKSRKLQLFWAEKILDQYLRLKKYSYTSKV